MSKSDSGFTLIELMIAVSIIAIIASIAIPNLLSARVQANETTAIAAMRTIATSQAQFRSGSNVDVDEDGAGEYGYFGELSGGTNVRTAGTTNGGQAIDPPILSAAFRAVNQGVVTRSGYTFRMWLPDADGIGVTEAASGGASQIMAADNCEVNWCCYAWPTSYPTTGNRVFVVNQIGDVFQSNNLATQYSGMITPPEPDAAFLNPATDDSIMGLLGIDTVATDGNRWIAVN